MKITAGCTRIALSSVLLMLSLGESNGNNSKNRSRPVSREDGMEEMEQQLERLCKDDPYLKYLHFNANLGSTSYEDCTWVFEKPDDRCLLEASNGGGNFGSTSPTLLRDICPRSCGLCPTDLLDPETDIDRDGNVSTDDLTMEQIKQLEIRLRRQKRNHKLNRKGRKPCPCPNGQNHNGGGGGGNGDDGNDDNLGPPVTGAPVPGPPVLAPTPFPTVGSPPVDMIFESPTFFPTFAGTTSGTWSGSWSGSTGATASYTSSYTSAYTSSYTSAYTSTGTSTLPEGAAVSSIISGQQSSLKKNSGNRRLVVTLTVIPILLLLLIFFCLVRWKKNRASRRGNKEDSDTDESDTNYPIHQTKTAGSDESRFKKVLLYFNGRQDDAQTDVHTCRSVTCEVCDNTPRRVMSVGSYVDEYKMDEVEAGERYRVKEVEC